MLATLTFDTSSVDAGIKQLTDLLQRKLLKEGAEAGGNVIQSAYRSAVPFGPTGSYKSASGAIAHFAHLSEAIGQRTLMYKDRTGVYAVVGVKAAAGNWRPLAPQGMWIEWGTDERQHKSDGQLTGKVTPQAILEKVVNQFGQAAQNAFIQTVQKGLEAFDVSAQ